MGSVGVIGGALGTYLMTRVSGTGTREIGLEAVAYAHRSKLKVLLGSSFFDTIQGKTVIDFGCGPGIEAVEMAQQGALHVLGVDIRQSFLDEARARAAAAGVADRCTFAVTPDRQADIVVSLDSFEHFQDPAAMLRLMADYVKPDGRVLVSFGPTWYHPYGGHFFSIFPWAHLVFTERAMIEWRRLFRPAQTARTVKECGLNKITVRRFERLVADSPFRFATFDPRPVRRAHRLYNRWTREFLTSVVQCTLVRKDAGARVAA
jgi:2-polyprenyl-3-methyl-5-hydroxy-6-metoxy-1,4-benzoquinol methylase